MNVNFEGSNNSSSKVIISSDYLDQKDLSDFFQLRKDGFFLKPYFTKGHKNPFYSISWKGVSYKSSIYYIPESWNENPLKKQALALLEKSGLNHFGYYLESLINNIKKRAYISSIFSNDESLDTFCQEFLYLILSKRLYLQESLLLNLNKFPVEEVFYGHMHIRLDSSLDSLAFLERLLSENDSVEVWNIFLSQREDSSIDLKKWISIFLKMIKELHPITLKKVKIIVDSHLNDFLFLLERFKDEKDLCLIYEKTQKEDIQELLNNNPKNIFNSFKKHDKILFYLFDTKKFNKDSKYLKNSSYSNIFINLDLFFDSKKNFLVHDYHYVSAVLSSLFPLVHDSSRYSYVEKGNSFLKQIPFLCELGIFSEALSPLDLEILFSFLKGKICLSLSHIESLEKKKTILKKELSQEAKSLFKQEADWLDSISAQPKNENIFHFTKNLWDKIFDLKNYSDENLFFIKFYNFIQANALLSKKISPELLENYKNQTTQGFYFLGKSFLENKYFYPLKSSEKQENIEKKAILSLSYKPSRQALVNSSSNIKFLEIKDNSQKNDLSFKNKRIDFSKSTCEIYNFTWENYKGTLILELDDKKRISNINILLKDFGFEVNWVLKLLSQWIFKNFKNGSLNEKETHDYLEKINNPQDFSLLLKEILSFLFKKLQFNIEDEKNFISKTSESEKKAYLKNQNKDLEQKEEKKSKKRIKICHNCKYESPSALLNHPYCLSCGNRDFFFKNL